MGWVYDGWAGGCTTARHLPPLWQGSQAGRRAHVRETELRLWHLEAGGGTEAAGRA